MITVLVDLEPFAGAELTLAGAAYRHLFRARRLPAGETLRVADGQGHARWGEVTRVDRASASITLGAPAPANEPPLRLDLLVAPPRPERAAWLVEKATEAGVSAIRFLNSERAPRSPGPATLARLRRIAAAALEQCHRSRLPDLTGPHPWADLDRLTASHPARFLLDPSAPTPALSLTTHPPPLPSAALLVGPEGGFSPAELDTLLAAPWTPLHLGPRTLRTETAALLATALLLLPHES